MKFLSALLLVAAGRATAKNLRTTEHRELPAALCLKAEMEPFGSAYPDVEGDVTVCFKGTSGTLEMEVEGLQADIDDGGVHIHTGTSCESADTQLGHYFKTDDPWLKVPVPVIAPKGTFYSTDDDGESTTKFKFDQGWGYSESEGKVIVIHDSDGSGYARIACGVLEATDE